MRARHRQHGASPCVPVAPRLPWTSVLPHEQPEPPTPLHRYTREANGAVLCGFCWQWCGTTRYKLVLDAAPPTDTIAVTRSTYVAHAQHTGLYDACSNYPPPSFHQPESVIQLNVTPLSIFVYHTRCKYTMPRLRGFLAFSLCLSHTHTHTLILTHSLTFSLSLSLSLIHSIFISI